MIIQGEALIGLKCLAPEHPEEGLITFYDEAEEMACVAFPDGQFMACHADWLRLKDKHGVYKINSSTGFDWWDVHDQNGEVKPPPEYLIQQREGGYQP